MFEQKFVRNLDRIGKRLEVYIENPNNEKSIHDIRTSLRRLDSTFSLLPKKLRKQNRKKIIKYREFFKVNGKMRDYDVISSKLDALGAPPDAKGALQKQRNAEHQRTLKMAKALKKMTPFELDGIADNDNDDKLGARFEKVIGKVASRVEKLLPIVLSDDTKVQELHRLRKTCKKLRYIIEVAPEYGIKKYNKVVAKAICNKSLEEIQNMLGAIHDSDVTIEYLHIIKSSLAEKEATSRRLQYLEFVRYMKKK